MTASGGALARVRGVLAVVGERRPEWCRLLRYAGVSAVAMPTTLLILWGLHSFAGWQAWQANLVAVSAGAVPAYVLNRYWVWRRSGHNRLWGEVLPFWAITLVGGVASTLAVDAAGRWDHAGLLVLVNLGTYGVLWLFKFFILDRFLWPSDPAGAVASPRVPAGERAPSQPSVDVPST